VSAWMAVSREKNDHPLVPLVGQQRVCDLALGRRTCSNRRTA